MTTSFFSQGLSNLRAWWVHLGVRDRRSLTLAAWVIGLYFIGGIAIRPAWQVLQKASLEITRLENQGQQLTQMAQETRELREVLPVTRAQSLASIQSATDRLGAQGRISVLGNQATLTLTGVTPQALQHWLREVRSAARARPVEVELSRTGQVYSGTIKLTIGEPEP